MPGRIRQLRREGRTTAAEEARAIRSFDAHWTELTVVELDGGLAREASELARSHPLRAPDAIHLASALSLAPEGPHRLSFACWDARLWKAASALGLPVVPATPPG